MRYRLRRIRKPQIFAFLMIASTVSLILPRHFFGPVRNLVSLTAYGPQKIAYGTMRAVGGGIEKLSSPSVSRAEYELLKLEKLALANENASLREQNARSDATRSTLAGYKSKGLEPNALIPAGVIALDASGGREALLLGKGRLSNLKNDAWVASRFLIGSGRDDGIADQSVVLARECLIGWIEDASPVNARVVLLSDPVARHGISAIVHHNKKSLADNGREVSFPLEGAGGGRMRLLDIFHDYVEKKQIAVGDEVLSQQTPQLPIPLVIGRIEKFERVPQKPVYFRAIVVPPFDPRTLEQVFVVDPSRPAAQHIH